MLFKKKSFSYLIATCILAASSGVSAQNVTLSTINDLNINVTQIGSQYNISGGTQAGANLFYSLQKLGLSAGEIANFLSNSNVQNILIRVTGGEASLINGLIQVTGGNSNLFIMNPAGIVFGTNASLNVPANFSASTASAMQVGNGWFGMNTSVAQVRNLRGNITGYDFNSTLPNLGLTTGTSASGVILNQGNLSVNTGKNVMLVGGMVVNTGTITTPEGKITIAATSDNKFIAITNEDSVLRFDLPIADQEAIGNLSLSINIADLNVPITLSSASILSGTATTTNVGVNETIQNGVDVSASDGTVNLIPTTYTLTDEVYINKNLTLNGNTTTVDGNPDTGLFYIDSANTVNINNLSLVNGNVSGSVTSINNSSIVNTGNTTFDSNYTFYSGSAIHTTGDIAIANSTFYGSNAVGIRDIDAFECVAGECPPFPPAVIPAVISPLVPEPITPIPVANVELINLNQIPIKQNLEQPPTISASTPVDFASVGSINIQAVDNGLTKVVDLMNQNGGTFTLNTENSLLTNIQALISGLRSQEIVGKSERVGLPMTNVEIVNPLSEDIPVDSIGHIRCRGLSKSEAFFNAPEFTASPTDLFRDDWYYSSDMASFDIDSYIHLKGRESDLIPHSDIEIHPFEIETIIMTLPLLKEVILVCIPIDNDASRSYPVVVFVANEGFQIRTLIDYCIKKLTPEKHPKYYSTAECIKKFPVERLIAPRYKHLLLKG